MGRSSRKHRDSDHIESTRDHKHRTTKHTDDNHHHRSDHCRRSEREKSEDVVKRERSYDRDDVNDTESREKSVDNRRNHKRKDRGYSDDEDRYNDARDKRKERRRFDDEREREERRERRKFEDRVKKEEVDFVDDDEVDKRSLNGETVVKSEPKDELFGGSNANGDAPGSHSKASGISRETPLALSHPPSKMEILQQARVGASRSMPYPRLKQLY